MLYALFRLLHFAFLLVYAGCVVIKNMALARKISREDAHNLTRINKVLALSSGLAVLVGLLLWLGVGRPAGFYSSNPIFLAKLALVFILIALSVAPARFLRSRPSSEADATINVPAWIRISVRMELMVLILVALLAGLMARGIGLTP